MSQPPEYKVNQHVEHLARFLPFGGGDDQLYEEHTVEGKTPRVETRALQFVRNEIEQPDLRLLVLTGDAGHGKTHLCRRLVDGLCKHHGTEAPTLDDYNGEKVITHTRGMRPVRVVKDLTEIADPRDAAELLKRAVETDDGVVVVCANEGRLRSVVSRGHSALNEIIDAVVTAVDNGLLPPSARVTVVDLNNQSVVGDGVPTIVDGVLDHWLDQDGDWAVCGTCAANRACPIRENRRLLAESPAAGKRRSGIRQLLKVVEQSGTVVTIRELLMLVSQSITGGLRCTDVHPRSSELDWQAPYLFHQAIFGEGVDESSTLEFVLLRSLRQIDPGHVASRRVDEHLRRAQSDAGELLPPPTEAEENPKTRAAFQSLDRQHRALMTFLRRRDFFDRLQSGVDDGTRLGLRHMEDFEAVVEGEPDAQFLSDVRNRLLGGLETIQGIRREQGANFLLVDPAFARSTGASLIARLVQRTSYSVGPASRRPSDLDPAFRSTSETVDWLERRVRLAATLPEGEHRLDLGLREFEYVLRANEGLSAPVFFEAENRRLLAALATVAGRGDDQGIIQVHSGGRLRQIVIDAETIQATD